MKVNAFITIYNTRVKHKSEQVSSDDVMGIIIDLIKPKSFLPYDDILNIIDQTIIDSEKTDYPTPNRYRLFIVNLISSYTNLECKIKDFDVLKEAGLLDVVISTFESEYQFCNNLMKMCYQDYIMQKG